MEREKWFFSGPNENYLQLAPLGWDSFFLWVRCNLLQFKPSCLGTLGILARGPCIARNIEMHLYELFISWETKMNEGMPYLQIWRGVRVSFCKIAIVCFLSIRYRSDGLYCKMPGTPSSPTQFFIRVEISPAYASWRVTFFLKVTCNIIVSPVLPCSTE